MAQGVQADPIDLAIDKVAGSQLKVRYQPPMVEYPPVARAARIQGTVVVQAVFDVHGDPILIKELSGPPILATAAKKWVSEFRYHPLVLNGSPRSFKTQFTLPFKLGGPPQDYVPSPGFLTAKAQLDAAREKRGGQGLVLEFKRVSSTELTCGFDVRGEGAWILSAIPKSDSSVPPKAIRITHWNHDGAFQLTRLVSIPVTVPEHETELTFILSTKHFGEAAWPTQLPSALNETKVVVFYLPDPSRK
ncbi:MAG TPA: energy transducer TonB [Holophagaceae bacterium]|nr:energy transducer TonB [Holophagaceae bacterium]